MSEYTHLYQNSYIVAIIVLIALLVIFYVFKIGYSHTVDPVTGVVTSKFNWRYPLAIALVVWILWNYMLFPRKDPVTPAQSYEYITTRGGTGREASDAVTYAFEGDVSLGDEHMNMTNWK